MESVMKRNYWRSFKLQDRIIDIIEDITDFKNLRENIDIDLLENEVLDSLSFVELITILEEEFNIEIQPTQVDGDTWRSINKISQLVNKLIDDKKK